mmetsp:Transcript_12132/g.15996  ORF Transcript_12132/g.15996 Transcript_12132/m.15996 type:complete len:233 (+) Transcript_12132:256-954(+)
MQQLHRNSLRFHLLCEEHTHHIARCTAHVMTVVHRPSRRILCEAPLAGPSLARDNDNFPWLAVAHEESRLIQRRADSQRSYGTDVNLQKLMREVQVTLLAPNADRLLRPVEVPRVVDHHIDRLCDFADHFSHAFWLRHINTRDDLNLLGSSLFHSVQISGRGPTCGYPSGSGGDQRLDGFKTKTHFSTRNKHTFPTQRCPVIYTVYIEVSCVTFGVGIREASDLVGYAVLYL